MKIKRLSLKDKKVFRKYLGLAEHELSVFAFENIYIWKGLFQIEWAIIEDSLSVFFRDQLGCFLYLAPLGAKKDPVAVEGSFEIMDRFNKNREISRVENVEEKEVDFYRRAGYQCQVKSYDYLCLGSDLAKLKGNKFKSQRASYNYFTRHYAFEYSPFTLKDKGECLKLYDSWTKARQDHNADRIYQGMLEDSRNSLKNMLDNYADLNLVGRVVRIDKKIRGFTFGFKLNPHTFCILYEITDLSVKGLAQFIFRKFSGDLADYKYINIMDDSGLENLKKVKLSYHPVRLIPAYIAKRQD